MPVSQPQAIPAVSPTPDADAALRAACADTLNELLAARKLIASQGVQIQRDAELQGIQEQLSSGLKDLRTLDATEKQNLRDAIAAAQRQITAIEAENAVLKKNQVTIWKRIKYVVIGGGIGVIVCAVLCKN